MEHGEPLLQPLDSKRGAERQCANGSCSAESAMEIW
jgi:hypothetical protein